MGHVSYATTSACCDLCPLNNEHHDNKQPKPTPTRPGDSAGLLTPSPKHRRALPFWSCIRQTDGARIFSSITGSMNPRRLELLQDDIRGGDVFFVLFLSSVGSRRKLLPSWSQEGRKLPVQGGARAGLGYLFTCCAWFVLALGARATWQLWRNVIYFTSTHMHTPHEKLLMELFLVPCRSYHPVTNVFFCAVERLDGQMGQRCYKYRFKTVSAMGRQIRKVFC